MNQTPPSHSLPPTLLQIPCQLASGPLPNKLRHGWGRAKELWNQIIYLTLPELSRPIPSSKRPSGGKTPHDPTPLVEESRYLYNPTCQAPSVFLSRNESSIYVDPKVLFPQDYRRCCCKNPHLLFRSGLPFANLLYPIGKKPGQKRKNTSSFKANKTPTKFKKAIKTISSEKDKFWH
jgi:hypothetical protein